MRVLVGVKRVVDYAVKVGIQPDKAGTAIVSRTSSVPAVLSRILRPSMYPCTSGAAEERCWSCINSSRQRRLSMTPRRVTGVLACRLGAIFCSMQGSS